jgi:hypothetical protein
MHCYYNTIEAWIEAQWKGEVMGDIMAIEYILYKLMSTRTISLHIVGNRGRIKEFPSSLYSTGTQRSLTEIYDRLYAKGPMSSSPFSPSHPGNVLVLSVIFLYS